MTTILLREYERRDGVDLPDAATDVLRLVFGATVQKSLTRADCVDVAMSDIVGAAFAGDATVVVQPKIDIAQVLFMLAYTADPSSWSDNSADLGRYNNLVAGITGLYVEMGERALRRGLLHGYHEVAEDSIPIRGRIDLAEQLRTRPGLDTPVAVRYAEYDADIVENQLLLAAGLLLRGLPHSDSTTSRRLHRLISSLAIEVTDAAYHPASVPAVTWTRLNGHYRPAVELARLLLMRATPHLSTGSQPVLGLTLKLSEVFEAFVRTALATALGVSAAAFPDGAHCPPLSLDMAGRVRLLPDLSWWTGSQCRFVGDVKYKRDSGSGLNPDLYQLYAYATATGLSQAMLIYADGPPTPARHTIPPLGIELMVEHLDLTQPPNRVLATIGSFADLIRTQPNRTAAAVAS